MKEIDPNTGFNLWRCPYEIIGLIDKILEDVKKMRGKERNWNNPFGDGRAGERVVKIVKGKNERKRMG